MSRYVSVDYVRYAAHEFLEAYESNCGDMPTGVLFNKFMTLLNIKLKESLGADIRLPHCWYRWGDEVVRHELPYIRWNHEDPSKTTVEYCGSIPRYEQKNDVMRFIDLYAREFIDRYTGSEGAEMAIDELYAHAPFEFQRRYRKLRENLKISRRSNYISNHTEMVRTLFEDAMDVFPEKPFKDACIQKTEFESVFRAAMESGQSQHILYDISESFWFYFCYHLRLNRDCHDNVRRETIRVWKDVIPGETVNYERIMQNYAYELTHGDTDDPVMLRLIEERESRLSEVDDLLEYMRCEGDEVRR